ncbi:MAG: outer membrane beta-barrel protein [Duncaniella sp.]|nr:outer membrane beta-barrel protein [Duncaniella sp.]
MKAKLIALMTALIVPFIAVSQSPVRGQKSFGITTGYVTSNRSASAGIEFSYAFSRRVVIDASVDYIFRNNNRDGILINIDYHGPWQIGNGKWYLYHILGINYSAWSRHSVDSELRDITTPRRHFGLDGGAGVAFNVSSTLRLHLQGKYNWAPGNSTALFNAGISYIF